MNILVAQPSGAPAQPPQKFVRELLRLRTVLVPTDFSEHSCKAREYAFRLAQQFGSTLVLLHVIEPAYPFPVDGVMHFPGELDDPSLARRPVVEKELARLADITAKQACVPVRSKVCSGRAYEEITAAARAENADLIVIATHGYTGLKHVVLGSTAERVVRHAPCPVLVVREQGHDLFSELPAAKSEETPP
jgi:nucleotide-binding universal stress UspA family protein